MVRVNWVSAIRDRGRLLRAGLILAAGMAVADTASARPEIPPSGDCQTMIADADERGVWVGRFSGRYADDVSDDRFHPISARGCFETEYACRRWTNELLSIATGSGLMSCRQRKK